MAARPTPPPAPPAIELFHTDPRRSSVKTQWMEQCQVGYLTAIAAQARCSVCKPSVDVHKIDQYITHEQAPGSPLGVQLKSTGVEASDPDFVRITINKATYNALRAKGLTWNYLFVLPLPGDGIWVRPGDDCYQVHRTMYWCDLRGEPALPRDQSSKTCVIPKSQKVTPEWLASVFKRYVEGSA